MSGLRQRVRVTRVANGGLELRFYRSGESEPHATEFVPLDTARNLLSLLNAVISGRRKGGIATDKIHPYQRPTQAFEGPYKD